MATLKYLNYSGLGHLVSTLLDKIGLKANTADLANVATSGKYSDLSGKPTIDSALSMTSTNAVQNKVVSTALNQKQHTLTAGSRITISNNTISATSEIDDTVSTSTSKTWSVDKIKDAISAISTLNIAVVQTLPTKDISTTTIYLVPKSTTQTHNVYDEYIYVSSAWELIGTTQVDLSNYYTKTQTNTLLNAKQPTTLATSVTIGTTTYTTVESALQELANRVTSSCYITTS
jgi:hypothetical protein